MKSYCTECRNWSKCPVPGRDWFGIYEIQFCRQQALWIIEMVLPLGPGVWPPCPEETGYTGTDPTIKRSRSLRAPFERPCQITGQLLERLGRTGTDGLLLLEQAQNGKRYEELHQVARDALNYCCGRKRKKADYLLWKRKRKYREEQRHVGKLPDVVCAGCNKRIQRHDANRLGETVGSGKPTIWYHLSCRQKKK